MLLIGFLVVSLLVVISLPSDRLGICLRLAGAALPPILLYPSAKRWFPFPQAVLAVCWGFAVLIPWAASVGSLTSTTPLLCCWFATLFWTFGFDTVYAMADRRDDATLGLRSSALTLGAAVIPTVRICYVLVSVLLAFAAGSASVGAIFWPFWLLGSVLMQTSCNPIRLAQASMAQFGQHFSRQVQIGALLLFGLILSRGL